MVHFDGIVGKKMHHLKRHTPPADSIAKQFRHLKLVEKAQHKFRKTGKKRGGEEGKEGKDHHREATDARDSSRHSSGSESLMENLLGLLRVKVIRGIDLAVRDVHSSDPYCVIKMGNQRLKTSIINKTVNPEWNEDLTLSIDDEFAQVKLNVFDHDTFTKDDNMGEAFFDIKPFIDALRMDNESLPSGTMISKVAPCRQNCLSDESQIMWDDGKVLQNIILRLRNVERGEVEVQLQWIDLPGAKGLV